MGICTVEEKFVGAILGGAVGDALGAPIEGMPKDNIVRHFGTYTDYLDPDKARQIEIRARKYGCYTDDTEMTLALVQTILEEKKVDPQKCAQSYLQFYLRGCDDYLESWRGYGTNTARAMKSLYLGEKTHENSGGDSDSNGGAMRIAPVGLVYRKVSDEALLGAVNAAVRCTHIHPDAVDGAYIQAKAVAYLTEIQPSKFDPQAFLQMLMKATTSEALLEKFRMLEQNFSVDMSKEKMEEVYDNVMGLDIIKATEAVACAIWSFLCHWKSPEEAVLFAINQGGDCDSTGGMTGALCGALHGFEWIPSRLLDPLENKDHMIEIAAALSKVVVLK